MLLRPSFQAFVDGGVPLILPIEISGSPPSAVANQSYSFTPTIQNGNGPRTFSLTGTLPTGLTFNTSTGNISGTPTITGTSSGLSISVTDSTRAISLGPFSIVVLDAGAAVVITWGGSPLTWGADSLTWG